MRPDLPSAMRAWLTTLSMAERTSVIVGGGETIDAMRRLDTTHRLNEVNMHWRCIRLLRATFEIASELFPEWQRIETQVAFDAYRKSAATGIHLIAVDTFLFPAANAPLPESWATTSDAIAAHLCQRLGADELVLLKSCTIPEDANLEVLAATHIIDEAILPLTTTIPKLRIEQFASSGDSR